MLQYTCSNFRDNLCTDVEVDEAKRIPIDGNVWRSNIIVTELSEHWH